MRGVGIHRVPVLVALQATTTAFNKPSILFHVDSVTSTPFTCFRHCRYPPKHQRPRTALATHGLQMLHRSTISIRNGNDGKRSTVLCYTAACARPYSQFPASRSTPVWPSHSRTHQPTRWRSYRQLFYSFITARSSVQVPHGIAAVRNIRVRYGRQSSRQP